jgi:uncharacterized membrane protein YhaH (DUF805 family)
LRPPFSVSTTELSILLNSANAGDAIKGKAREAEDFRDFGGGNLPVCRFPLTHQHPASTLWLRKRGTIQTKRKEDQMKWYLAVLKKYAEFNGRAGREEFWMFVLINFIVSLILSIIRPLGLIYGLAVLVPSLAVGARRLHDTGRSGWFQLLVLIPLIGPIVLIVFAAQDGQPGDNQYGSNPKSV